jgi:transcriptional regulator with PAS, ATPase and Fis domain
MSPTERAVLLLETFYRELTAQGMAIDRETFAAELSTIADRLRAGTNGARATLGDEVRRLEQRRVHESLERHGGNLSSVARELGIARPRLYRILKRDP